MEFGCCSNCNDFWNSDVYFGVIMGALMSIGFKDYKCINSEDKEKPKPKSILDYAVYVKDESMHLRFCNDIQRQLSLHGLITLRDIRKHLGMETYEFNSERYIWFGNSVHDIIRNPEAKPPCKLYFKPCIYIERKD